MGYTVSRGKGSRWVPWPASGQQPVPRQYVSREDWCLTGWIECYRFSSMLNIQHQPRSIP